MRKTQIAILFLLSAISCDPRSTGNLDLTPMAYIPQYASVSEVKQVSVQAARATERAGKIYAYSNYIFQSDVQQGIHIIDNGDHKHPVKLAFLKVPFSTEIAIKGNFLYTNNLNDIVVFDISSIQAPRLVNRIENVFPAVTQNYPPYTNVLFECPDLSKGIIVKWELKPSKNALCRR